MKFHNKFCQFFFFPLGDVLSGQKNSNYFRFIQKSQWYSPDELKRYQNNKLRKLIKHAYENVPYYYNIFQERNLSPEDIQTSDDLIKLPFLTKAIIRKNFPHNIVAKNIPKKKKRLRK